MFLHEQFWIDDRLEWHRLVGVGITAAMRSLGHETDGISDAF
jgi:hypothetical protein